MKRLFINFSILIVALLATVNAIAQEKSSCETQCKLSLEIASCKIWRGLEIGSGPSYSPYFSIKAGNFEIGGRGTMCSGEKLGFKSDLFAKYRLPFDLTLEVVDYYAGGNYFGTNFDNIAKTHEIEPGIRYDYGKLQFFGALLFGDNDKCDFYGEVSYDFDILKVTIGGGEGMYTTSTYGTGGDFAICNISVSKETSIHITDRFSLPVMAGLSLNPSLERFYAYAGFRIGNR